MTRYRCNACSTNWQQGKWFEFEGKRRKGECPQCGRSAAPDIARLTDVHLVVPDRSGPLVGLSGMRQKVACDENRAYLATAGEHYAATDDPRAVTCPKCREQKVWQEMAGAYDEMEEVLEEMAVKATLDLGEFRSTPAPTSILPGQSGPTEPGAKS